MPVGPGPDTDTDEDNDNDPTPPTIEEVANLTTLTDAQLARKLAKAIRLTADDMRADPPKRYSYEEWAEYTHLIRFTRMSKEELEREEEEEGIVEWDWIGEDSPMLAEETESEWVLDRLCESLGRYMRKQVGGGLGREQMGGKEGVGVGVEGNDFFGREKDKDK